MKHIRRLFALLLLAFLLPSLSLADHETSSGTSYYVRTENGKTLNLRNDMSTGRDSVIGHIPYGAKVTVFGFYESDTWAEVDYNGNIGYVMTKFLTRTDPGKYGAKPAAAPAETPETFPDDESNPPVSPDIYLRANPSTGYAWTAVNDNEKSVAVVDNGFTADSSEEPAVGVPGVESFRLDGYAEGTAKITFTYQKADESPLQTITMNVIVNAGLDVSIYDLTVDGN